MWNLISGSRNEHAQWEILRAHARYIMNADMTLIVVRGVYLILGEKQLVPGIAVILLSNFLARHRLAIVAATASSRVPGMNQDDGC
jgi:hypothetical protein